MSHLPEGRSQTGDDMELGKHNVSLAGFGMDCFAVVAPTGVDTDKLTEFLKQSNACQRENIEYSYMYDHEEEGMSCFVFNESGAWKL